MAKTLKQLDNKIRVKYLVKTKKYFLFWGNIRCMIDGKYQQGFNSQEEAEKTGNSLIGNSYRKTTSHER